MYELNLVKSALGGLVLGAIKFFPLPQVPLKMMLDSKVVQIDSKT